MAMEISGAQRVQAVYGRQQFYADRTAELKIPKTVQVGSSDRVTLSPDVQAMRSAQSPSAASQTATATQASVYLYSQPVKQVTYEDPRRVHSHTTENETASADRSEPDQKGEDSDFTPGIASSGETGGGAAAGTR